MFCKRLVLAVLILGITFPLPAAMVSFLVIEEGLKPGSDSGNYSAVWEDGLMGVFFDAGHIVSNSPILRVDQLSEAEFPSEARFDFIDAADGGADYFILAVLDYNTQERLVKPKSVFIKIFTIESRQLVFEGQFPAGNGVNLQDEYSRVKDVGKIIASQIKDN